MLESGEKYIQKADRAYRNKIRKNKRKKKRKRKVCFWPGCNGKIQAMGLCARDRARYYSGSLLRMDYTAFPPEEMLELYHDILKFAERMKIHHNIAAVWLLAAGLNYFDCQNNKEKE